MEDSSISSFLRKDDFWQQISAMQFQEQQCPMNNWPKCQEILKEQKIMISKLGSNCYLFWN